MANDVVWRKENDFRCVLGGILQQLQGGDAHVYSHICRDLHVHGHSLECTSDCLGSWRCWKGGLPCIL